MRNNLPEGAQPWAKQVSKTLRADKKTLSRSEANQRAKTVQMSVGGSRLARVDSSIADVRTAEDRLSDLEGSLTGTVEGIDEVLNDPETGISTRLDAARDAFDEFVPSVNGEITALQDRAEQVTQEMLAEKDRVNAELGPVKGDLAVLKTETLPALQADLADAEVRTAAAATAAGEAKADALVAINEANSAVVTADEAKTAANTAQADATTAQAAAQQAKSAADTAKATADTTANDLLTLSGKTGRVIRSTTAPTGDDRNANNLWLNTTSGQLSEWNGTAWTLITDSRLTAATSAAAAAQTRADQAVNASGAAQERADLAKDLADAANLLAGTADSKAATAQAAATAAGSSAATAQSKADSAFANAATAQSTADQAKTAAATAQSKADTAAADLLALAGKSGRLIRSATAPTSEDDKNVNNLWLNTGNGQLSQWTGTAWTLITDSRLTAATSAAAAAQSTADTAKTNAATAQARADSAFTNAATAKTAADNAMAAALGAQSAADTADGKATTANGRITIGAANPTAADAVGKPIGALWEVRSGSTVLRRFVLTAASTWTQVKAGQDFVGEGAIGQAQIADAAVGTAQIADATITNAKIGDLAVDKLTAVGGATFPTAVIDTLVGQDAFINNLYASRMVVAPEDNLFPLFWEAGTRGAALWPASVGWSSNEGWQPPGLSGCLYSTGKATTPYPGGPANKIPVTAGEQISFEIWVGAIGAGSVMYVELRDQNGTHLPGSAYDKQIGSAPNYLIGGYTVPTAWTRHEVVVTIPTGVTAIYISNVYWNHGSGTTVTQGLAIRARRKVGSVLIEDGAITAPKITASQELSAKVAQFLEVETGKITWDNAAGNQAFIGSLVGQDAFFKRMMTDQMVVSSGNLIPGVDTIATSNAGWSAFGRNTDYPAYWLKGQTTKYTDAPIPLVEGQEYTFSCEVRTNVSGARFYIQISDFDSSTGIGGVDGGTSSYLVSNQVAGLNTFTKFSSVFKSPITGRARLRIYSMHPNGAQNPDGYLWYKDVTLRKRVGAVLIEDGAVSADKFASKINLSNTFVAGPETGYHTRLDQTGLHFLSKVKGNTQPVEVLAINTPGTNSDGDVFTLLNPNDLSESTMSINEAGQGSFSDLTVANVAQLQDVTIRGRTFEDYLDTLPRGVVAWGEGLVAASRTIAASTVVTFGTINFVAEPGRLYRVTATGPSVQASVASTASVRLEIAGSAGSQYGWLGVGWNKGDMTRVYDASSLAVETQTTVAYLIGVSAGGSAVTHPSYRNLAIVVEDVGPAITPEVSLAVSQTGDAPVVPAKKQYTKTWNTAWLRTFPTNSFYSGKATQGTWSGTTYRGFLGFPNMLADIGSAEIVKIEAYVYMSHWYYNAGGTLSIQGHGQLLEPTAQPGVSGTVVSLKTAKPGGGWVTLPSTYHAGFKAGTLRGIALVGSGLAAYGYATSAQLRVTYKK